MSKRTQRKIGLVLGGGAPNATLMSGALLAFSRQGVRFDVVSCTGAGATIGLMYLAPVGGDCEAALKSTIHFGVADEIYDHLPVNYKVFNKPGEQADAFRRMLAAMPDARAALGDGSPNPVLNFWQDWAALYAQSLCPSDLGADSLGLCAHVPFIEDVVDFAAVPHLDSEVYINAYNLSESRPQTWGKREITHRHYQAALSFPFLYPPYPLDDMLYCEGAIRDCLNFQPFVAAEGGAHEDVELIVVLDVLGNDKLLRAPRNLWDAYVLSIIAPLVDVARSDLELFELKHNRDAAGRPRRAVLKLPFAIPDDYYPQVLDWSRFNLEKLFRIGYNSALDFCRQHADALGIRFDPAWSRLPIRRQRQAVMPVAQGPGGLPDMHALQRFFGLGMYSPWMAH